MYIRFFQEEKYYDSSFALRACLNTTARSVFQYKWSFSFGFKTEGRSFSHQKRSPNGTVLFLPNRPPVFTRGPFSCVGLFKAHLKANTTTSSSLFSNSFRLYISPHPFLILSGSSVLSPPYLHLSPCPDVPATYLLLFTPLASFTLGFFFFSYHHSTWG